MDNRPLAQQQVSSAREMTSNSESNGAFNLPSPPRLFTANDGIANLISALTTCLYQEQLAPMEHPIIEVQPKSSPAVLKWLNQLPSVQGPITPQSSRSSTDFPQQYCCIVERGERCKQLACGKILRQKQIKVIQAQIGIAVDAQTSTCRICRHHKSVIKASIGESENNKEEEKYTAQLEKVATTSGDDGSSVPSHLVDRFMLPPSHSQSAPSHIGSIPGHSMGSGSPRALYHRDFSITSNSSYEINLHSLSMATLRQYKKQFRVRVKTGSKKAQLAEEVAKHFRRMKVSESDVVRAFLRTVKPNANKPDY